MFKRYKWNFVFVVLIVSGIGFLMFDAIFYYSIKQYLFQKTMDEMRMKSHLAVMWLKQKNLPSSAENIEALEDISHQIKDVVNARVTIIDSLGVVLTDSDVPQNEISQMDNHLQRPEVQQALSQGWGQNYRTSDTVKLKLFYTAFSLKQYGSNSGFLRLAYYAHDFTESLNKVINLFAASNLIGLGILIIASLILGNVVTFPILKIARIAQKISDGELERSFPVRRKDEIGTLTRVLNQLTARLKRQIQQISSERAKLENILTNLDVGVIVVDDQNTILQANPEIHRILGAEFGSGEHATLNEILGDASIKVAIRKSMADSSKEVGEFVRQRDGKKIFLSYVVVPFMVPEKESFGALIQLHDITELRTLEAIRRDFVANASHELKTPLTAIMGYAETLIDGAADNPHSRMKFIRRIREQSQRLEFLVADLLKLSEVERESPIQLHPVALAPLINDVIEEYAEQAGQKEYQNYAESVRRCQGENG